MENKLDKAVNAIGGVHPDWGPLTSFKKGFREGAKWQKENMWISVKDELPEYNKPIIIKTDLGLIFNGHHEDDGDWMQVDGVKINIDPPVYSSSCSIPKEWIVIAWMYEPIFEKENEL